MKKKLIKIIEITFIVFTIFNIFLILRNKSFALGDVTTNLNIWVDPNQYVGEDLLNKKASIVTGIIRSFGIVASIVTLAIIGIRIMFGSIEEKANYKQTLLPWTVGAVMLFAMTMIPTIIYDFANEIDSGEVEVLSSGVATYRFCKNKHLMTNEGDDMHQKWVCRKDCGYTGFSNSYEAKGCKSCKNQGIIIQPLVEINSGLYCPHCGNVYKK